MASDLPLSIDEPQLGVWKRAHYSRICRDEWFVVTELKKAAQRSEGPLAPRLSAARK